jgi:hypothetical protein
MTSDAVFPLEERVLQLFQQLGIERAHIAARNVGDWQGFATSYPGRIASLSLLCPIAPDMRPYAGLAARTLVITGDRGAAAEQLATALQIAGSRSDPAGREGPRCRLRSGVAIREVARRSAGANHLIGVDMSPTCSARRDNSRGKRDLGM